MSLTYKTTWKEVKTFIDETQLYLNLNYKEFENEYVVWINYEDMVMWTQISKSDANVDDLLANYAPKTVVKKTILSNGSKQIATQGVLDQKYSRKFCYQGSTSSINDPKNYFSCSLYDVNNQPTVNPAEVVSTHIRFEPDFDYDIIGGKVQILDFQKDTDEIYVDAIGNPEVPASIGGSIGVIVNEKYTEGHVELESKESMPLKYIPGFHTNVVVMKLNHTAGLVRDFQLAITFYWKFSG